MARVAEQAIDDVAIVGGGHAGLLAGATLARLGFSVRLIERADLARLRADESEGRSLAVLAGSIRIADRFGVWRFLAPHGAPVWRTEVSDTAAGQRIVYDMPDGSEAFGYGFAHAALRQGLLAAFLEQPGEAGFRRGEIADLERGRDAMTLVLADGDRCRARLVVAADGRQSRIRQLAGIAARQWSYQQAALALIVEHSRPHGQVVREWLRPGGPLALLPLPGNCTGVTWVESSDFAGERLASGPEALLRELGELTNGVLGQLRLASGPSLYPLGALHAERYVAPRLALVGDAAHGVHPIHAQGFNMGVADVGALAEALHAARQRGIDPGSGDALLPYARRRRPANDRRLLLTDTLSRLFSTSLAPLAGARGLALATVDRLPPLKRLAIRRGMQLD